MPRHPNTICVLDCDPDLGEGLDPQDFALAREHAVARVAHFDRGPWKDDDESLKSRASLGLLIIDGLLVRKITVAERTCAELLGPGDVLRPWQRLGVEPTIAAEVNWLAAEPLRMAVLDRAFTARVARWPEIAAAINGRVMLRVHWLGFHLAVCHRRRLEERLLIVLWQFADRWGRMTGDGAVIGVPLTHSLLASVVGAHRPSVTNALGRLTEEGLVESLPSSRWRLHGVAPEELRHTHEHAAGHHASAITLEPDPS